MEHIGTLQAIALSASLIVFIYGIVCFIDFVKSFGKKCPECGKKGMKKASTGWYTFDYCTHCKFENN